MGIRITSYRYGNLNGVNFSGRDLEGVDFYRAKLNGASLEGAILSGANFYGAEINNANLTGAVFDGADFSNADASYTDFSKISGEGADLHHGIFEGSCFQGANLSGAKLYGSNMTAADLKGANLEGADLECANLYRSILDNANIARGNLRYAVLLSARLRDAVLRGADLEGANLEDADIRDADFSGARGFPSAIDYLNAHFEVCAEGYIVYKVFGEYHEPPEYWEVSPGAILKEACDPNPTVSCGCGINVATLDCAREYASKPIWRCLIRWGWLAGVVVPYNADGEIRCERVELLEVVDGGREEK